MATTLIERAQLLSNDITDLKAIDSDSDDAERYQTRATQVADLSQKLTSVSTSIKFLRDAGIDVGISVDQTKNFVSQLLEYEKKVEAAPNSIIESDEQWRFMLINPLKEKCKAWESLVARQWKNHLVKALSIADEELLDVFREIDEFKETADLIQDINNRVEPLYDVNLPGLSDIELVETFKNMLQEAWNKLSSVGIPESVRDFLIKASQSSATLNDLDEVVIEWVEANNVGPYIRIGFHKS